VEADSAVRAREIVERDWQHGIYVLGAENFQDVTFTVPKERTHER
jgi:hypothetical protein